MENTRSKLGSLTPTSYYVASNVMGTLYPRPYCPGFPQCSVLGMDFYENSYIFCRWITPQTLVTTVNGQNFDVTGSYWSGILKQVNGVPPALNTPKIAGLGDVAIPSNDVISWVTANPMIAAAGAIAVTGLIVYLVRQNNQSNGRPKTMLNGTSRRKSVNRKKQLPAKTLYKNDAVDNANELITKSVN